MPTLDELLERERLKNAPPSPGMQRAIDETVAEIRAAFDRPRDPAPTPALNREEAERHG